MPDSPDFIEVYDNALDASFCEQIIQQFEQTDSGKGPGKTGAGLDRVKKDSTDITITGKPQWQNVFDSVLDATLRKLLQYTLKYPSLLFSGVTFTVPDPNTGEPIVVDEKTIPRLDDMQVGNLMTRLYRPGKINIQKYEKGSGGYHHWHSEVFPRGQDCEALHRVLLFMFYLNTVEDGGETEFYHQGRKVSPQQGRMVIAPAGFTHTHKGHVPQSDDKYIITSWVMFQRAEQLFSQTANPT